jgi:hypothetical protein
VCADAGEIDCGDAWHLVSNGEHTAVIMVDGLGHGSFAAQAAQVGIESFTRLRPGCRRRRS